MAVGAEAKVFDSLSGILRSAKQKSVGSSGGAQSKLIESKSLTTGLLNPGASSGSEAESGNRELGDGEKAVVVGHGSDHNNCLALVGVGNVGDNARDGNRGAVDPGHEKATEHDLVEV